MIDGPITDKQIIKKLKVGAVKLIFDFWYFLHDSEARGFACGGGSHQEKKTRFSYLKHCAELGREFAMLPLKQQIFIIVSVCMTNLF